MAHVILYFLTTCSVCYIAGQLVEALNKHCPPKEEKLSKWFTPQEKMCVQIAALCHDIGMYQQSCLVKFILCLGHGPFSHVYDFAVKEYYKELETKPNGLEKMKEFITSEEDEYGDNENVDSYVKKKELPKVIIIILGCSFMINTQKAKHEYRSALIVKCMMNKLTFDKRFEKDKGCYINLIQDMITFSEVHVLMRNYCLTYNITIRKVLTMMKKAKNFGKLNYLAEKPISKKHFFLK